MGSSPEGGCDLSEALGICSSRVLFLGLPSSDLAPAPLATAFALPSRWLPFTTFWAHPSALVRGCPGLLE